MPRMLNCYLLNIARQNCTRFMLPGEIYYHAVNEGKGARFWDSGAFLLSNLGADVTESFQNPPRSKLRPCLKREGAEVVDKCFLL